MGWFDSEAFKGWDWKDVAIWAAAALAVGGLIAVLVVAFAVVYPPKATADDAALGRFALALVPGSSSPSTAVSYNVSATVSLRNPNIYWAIRYGAMAVAFSFNGSRFDDSAAVPGFLHAARKAATFRVAVGGVSRPVKLSGAGVREFRVENATGVFDVELRLDAEMQYKGRKAKCPLVVVCPLKLQLADPDVAATAYQKTKCTVLRASRMSGC